MTQNTTTTTDLAAQLAKAEQDVRFMEEDLATAEYLYRDFGDGDAWQAARRLEGWLIQARDLVDELRAQAAVQV
jgi:hypothetical protein